MWPQQVINYKEWLNNILLFHNWITVLQTGFMWFWVELLLLMVYFFLQPIKENYNPQPSKLLRDEWKNQWEKEIELLLFLQKTRNFPKDVNVHDVALKLKLNHGNAQSDKCNTSTTYSNTSRTRISRIIYFIFTNYYFKKYLNHFKLWFMVSWTSHEDWKSPFKEEW